MGCNLTDERPKGILTRNPNPKHKGYYLINVGIKNELEPEDTWEYENYIVSYLFGDEDSNQKTYIKKVTEEEFKIALHG